MTNIKNMSSPISHNVPAVTDVFLRPIRKNAEHFYGRKKMWRSKNAQRGEAPTAFLRSLAALAAYSYRPVTRRFFDPSWQASCAMDGTRRSIIFLIFPTSYQTILRRIQVHTWSGSIFPTLCRGRINIYCVTSIVLYRPIRLNNISIHRVCITSNSSTT